MFNVFGSRLLMAAAAVSIAAAIVLPVAPTRTPGPAGSESWDPLPASPAPVKVADVLGAIPLWGAVAISAEADALAQEPPWRISGIVRRGSDRFALLKVEGQPERQLSVRDRLPGGSEILSIEEDSLCILVNGQKRRLAIFKVGSQEL